MHKSVKTSAALIWLICFWSIGCAFGILIANGKVEVLAASLQLAANRGNSLFALSALLPVLAVYLVSRLGLPGLIFPILFLKSVADSFLLMGICAAFGSAAWLAGTLFLFTDKVSTVLLLYFSGKCLTEYSRPQTARFISVLIMIAITIAVDRLCISPYFSYLML